MAATRLCEQSGFSLLEVLVTLVILSLGILGAAGLQRAALQNGHSALLRAQAAQYAYDMADRMRANRAVAVPSTSTSASTSTGTSTSISPYAQPLTPATALPGSNSQADRDRRVWLRQLQSLPLAAAAIDVQANGDATITIRWDESALGATGVDRSCPAGSSDGQVCFVLNTRL